MNFILNKRVKYYTKEIFKYISLIIIALFIILTIIFLKYNLVYEVSISGKSIGYIKNKYLLENRIRNLQEKEGKGNIAFVDIKEFPKYKLIFLNKGQELNESEVLAKIEENVKISYRYYEIVVNGNQKSIVNSLQDAENLVTEMKNQYKDCIKFKIAINELYSENSEEYVPQDIIVAKKEISKQLQDIKKASVNGIYLAQKPISGKITSRYGNREYFRSHAHTGLDIAAPYGTPIKAAADGKVICSRYEGSYGNLIIVDCGNNVNIYYGHCSKLYVKVGKKIKAGDKIGAVGSTGNATGNHLHFEIRVNGKTVNPQNYIYK